MGPETPQGRKRSRVRVRVRCLGPGKEHTFLSADKTRNRVCEPCRKKLAEFSVAVMRAETMPGRMVKPE